MTKNLTVINTLTYIQYHRWSYYLTITPMFLFLNSLAQNNFNNKFYCLYKILILITEQEYNFIHFYSTKLNCPVDRCNRTNCDPVARFVRFSRRIKKHTPRVETWRNVPVFGVPGLIYATRTAKFLCHRYLRNVRQNVVSSCFLYSDVHLKPNTIYNYLWSTAVLIHRSLCRNKTAWLFIY